MLYCYIYIYHSYSCFLYYYNTTLAYPYIRPSHGSGSQSSTLAVEVRTQSQACTSVVWWTPLHLDRVFSGYGLSLLLFSPVTVVPLLLRTDPFISLWRREPYITHFKILKMPYKTEYKATPSFALYCFQGRPEMCGPPEQVNDLAPIQTDVL